MAAPRAQRADARRNIAAILDAATECLARDPEMSIAGIAAAAGVGRITLYGHFKTRADLVDAVLVRTVQQCDAILDATDTSGDPAEALARLVASSWQLVHQFRNILLAAQRELPAERIRGVHDRILRRMQSLIEQGQRAGSLPPRHAAAMADHHHLQPHARRRRGHRRRAADPGDAAGHTATRSRVQPAAGRIPGPFGRRCSERAVVLASAAEVLPGHGQARGEEILHSPWALPVGRFGADREPAGEGRQQPHRLEPSRRASRSRSIAR